MIDVEPLAIVCGVGLGLGLWMLVSLVPRLSRPSLALRVAPHVTDVSPAARELLDRRTANPVPLFGALLEPVIGRLRRLVISVIGGAETTGNRLRQAGIPLSVEAFRSRQIVWSLAGAAVGVAVAIVASSATSVSLAAQVALVLLGAVGGFVVRGSVLKRAATARVERMEKELPTVLEFLTLSLSAGEGILDAVRRVARISRGELAAELGSVVAEVTTGVPFAEAITRCANQLRLTPFTRAVEQITGALERGTPLADVLRAQAQDARDESKRELLELSGKKEVAMLVPLVFLILPITIVIAVFPAVLVLQVGL
jgi:tight adherence protein C